MDWVKNFVMVFQILMAMQRELANSGMTQDEILAKMLLLQKAMAGDNSPAFINKTIRNALQAANISPDELSKVRLLIFFHTNFL